MATIAQQLIDLNTIKGNIKTSIINKGVDVSSSDAFSVYPSKIDAISAGGPAETFNIGLGFNSTINALAVDSSNHIYAGGGFTTYKGLAQNRLIRLNSDGSKDITFDVSNGFNSTINVLSIDSSNHLYVGGGFTTYKGLAQNRLIRLNSDGSKDITFDVSNGFNNGVYSLKIDSSNLLYVGGAYTTYQGLTQNRLIRLNSDGSKDSTFDISAGFSGATSTAVWTIAIDPSNYLYVGGNFTVFPGMTAKHIVRLYSDGTIDPSLVLGSGATGGPNDIVYAIAIDSSNSLNAYIGGAFTSYKGESTGALIRINFDGSRDTSFNIGTGIAANNGTKRIQSLIIDSSNHLYAGGTFYAYKGISQNKLIRINPDGSKDTAFDISSGFNSDVYSVILDSSNNVYAGGAFYLYGNNSIHYYLPYLIRLLNNGSSDTCAIG